ncbi:twitching motility protein PilT [Verrucomicrobiota bacterium]|nr:twitching motility protein PilT [Verrucomicrobiota bacterium]
MNAVRFLDTNVLLYAYDLDAPAKREVALRLVEQGLSGSGDTAISVQVLQEMHVNLEKQGVSRSEAGQIIRDCARLPVVNNTLDLLLSALEEQARWKISLWDALILAAARASGASELFTEDLNNGQDYGGVRVINPFL